MQMGSSGFLPPRIRTHLPSGHPIPSTEHIYPVGNHYPVRSTSTQLPPSIRAHLPSGYPVPSTEHICSVPLFPRHNTSQHQFKLQLVILALSVFHISHLFQDLARSECQAGSKSKLHYPHFPPISCKLQSTTMAASFISSAFNLQQLPQQIAELKYQDRNSGLEYNFDKRS